MGEGINSVTLQADHAAMVAALMKSSGDITATLRGEGSCWHVASGFPSEGGELFDAVKRWVLCRKALDMANVVEELGDLEFYLQALRAELGITRAQTLRANITKLSARYPVGTFTDTAAIARADKDGG